MNRTLPLVLSAATLALWAGATLAADAAPAAAKAAAAKPAAQKPAAGAKAGAAEVPASDADKTLFAIGEVLAGQTRLFAFTPAEQRIVASGFRSGLAGGAPGFDASAYTKNIGQMITERQKAAGSAARALAAKEKDAQTLPSGVVIRTLAAGTGPSPTEADQVKVNYEGRLVDGTLFDSSIQRGQPATFPLAGVVKCWTEALQHMKVGGKAKIWCPSDVAYGDRGNSHIPGGATLVFDVQLLEIEPPAPPVTAEPATPAAPAAPAAPATPAEPASH